MVSREEAVGKVKASQSMVRLKGECIEQLESL